MNEGVILDFAREAIYVTIISAAPLLLTALIIGLLVSLFQTITSIQEQTLAFVPKILAIFVGVLIFGSFMGNTIVNFFIETVSSFKDFIR